MNFKVDFQLTPGCLAEVIFDTCVYISRKGAKSFVTEPDTLNSGFWIIFSHIRHWNESLWLQ